MTLAEFLKTLKPRPQRQLTDEANEGTYAKYWRAIDSRVHTENWRAERTERAKLAGCGWESEKITIHCHLKDKRRLVRILEAGRTGERTEQAKLAKRAGART